MQDKCKNYADQLDVIRQEVCVLSNNFIANILDTLRKLQINS